MRLPITPDERNPHDAEIDDADPYAIGATCMICGQPVGAAIHEGAR